ncbi:glucose-1-phosphate cytidylyltransferase [Pseudophaeobacter sp. TrK17]|jgi:glucose-1-phosphate cytidylyltransferase|uniref:glucose-1-phosphate cytidylyltransferase n=1 Tax=Pseudophaeobacter sp. TrK17 TaxID=2815167 RepID=UPI0035D06B5F
MVKAIILAGGLGTRISEESHLKPKPMIEIGGKPILWHIMKTYAHHGVTEFVVCCGYKGYLVKEYFANYFLHNSDITFDLSGNKMRVHRENADPWKVTLVDTGELTMTGGRIKRVADYVDDTFCLTYGDGVSDINIRELLAFHRSRTTEVTVTAIQPSGRFGSLTIEDNLVTNFQEKPKGDGQWVNGGFMVCEPSVFDRLTDDETVFEQEPLMGLARDRQLSVFKHHGFWSAMDTLRDRNYLEKLWADQQAPWKLWS